MLMNEDLSVQLYFQALKARLASEGDPFYAERQAKYLKNHFAFFGLRARQWLSQFEQFTSENGLLAVQDLPRFIRLCFEDEHRELHYMAIEMSQRLLKKVPVDFIDDLEYMMVHQSWWDSVDWLAKLIGIFLNRYPDMKLHYFEKWMKSDNLWLIRVSIIFQLHYKAKTDFTLLSRAIVHHKHHKDFFIRKASGWALRAYSKFEPRLVLQFVDSHPELSMLTKREAIRKIIL